MSDSLPLNVRIRLSLMMFMQYLYFAVFFVPLAAYITNMGVKGWLYATIMSSMPLGCLISPIVCMIADRHFSSNKVLMVLNFMCAALLLVATKITSPVILFVVLLLAMFCYMPTWSLTNAIALANCPAEKFPQIRSLGSIGWVASGLFGLVAYKFLTQEVDGQTVPLKIDGTVIPLYCGAATALVTGILNLTLPNTPPPAKGKESSFIDALGLPALKLMKDLNFAVFIIVSSLIMIPFVAYFSYNSQFLQQMGFTLITPTMNMGQLFEMVLMLLVPLSLAKFGIKKTMIIGLVALIVRYVAYWVGGALDQRIFYFAGIWIHGIIFGFFFVGGQVYIDKKAPPEIRAQAQGLIGLLCFGIGWLVGNFVNAMLIDYYTVIQDGGEALTNWNPIWMITIISSAALLIGFSVFFKDDVRAVEAIPAEDA